jgi:hypothetical protein
MAKKLVGSKHSHHMTHTGRGRFLKLARPESIESIPGSSKRYGASIILPPGPKLDVILNDIMAVGRANWPDFETSQLAHRPFETGEEVIARINKTSEKGCSEQTMELYHNATVLTAYCGEDRDPPKCYIPGSPPTMLPRRPGNDADLKAIEEQFYDGCFIRMACRVFAYQRSEKQFGVSLFLMGVRFMSDGDRLGSVNLDSVMAEDEEVPEDQCMDSMQSEMEMEGTNI